MTGRTTPGAPHPPGGVGGGGVGVCETDQLATPVLMLFTTSFLPRTQRQQFTTMSGLPGLISLGSGVGRPAVCAFAKSNEPSAASTRAAEMAELKRFLVIVRLQ
jgi:hypothetical protein